MGFECEKLRVAIPLLNLLPPTVSPSDVFRPNREYLNDLQCISMKEET